MSLYGVTLVDLRNTQRDRMRARVSAALTDTPNGAAAIVQVGALAAEPEAVRVIREHQHRLAITIEGQPYAVRRWLDAVRDGLPGEAGVLL